MDDEIDMDEAAQVCLLNTLQPGGSLVAAGKNLSISMSMPPCSRASEDTGLVLFTLDVCDAFFAYPQLG